MLIILTSDGEGKYGKFPFIPIREAENPPKTNQKTNPEKVGTSEASIYFKDNPKLAVRLAKAYVKTALFLISHVS